MSETFRAIQIAPHVYWVGAIDWTIRNFHGYSTTRGTTYNAYLVMAEKVTLIDTVKKPFYGEMMARIRSVVDPAKIEYIVSNHTEMDHSGALGLACSEIKPGKFFASPAGAKALREHFHGPVGEAGAGLGEITIVKSGEKLSLGDLTLAFLETPMLHWPDSMVSYLVEDELLFSQDGFGMHLATGERFADELPSHLLEYEARKYYANILLPFSPLVVKLAKTIEDMGLKISILAPDHGPVWRKDVGFIIDLWKKWATVRGLRKAVIAYDTMWNSTELLARSIADGLISKSVPTQVIPLGSSDRSAIATEIMDAGAFLVGSPTINNNIYPTLADLLVYLKGLKPRITVGGAFGSFGWSGEAVAHVSEQLKGMCGEVVEPLKVKYVPTREALEKCFDLGVDIASRLKA